MEGAAALGAHIPVVVLLIVLLVLCIRVLPPSLLLLRACSVDTTVAGAVLGFALIAAVRVMVMVMMAVLILIGTGGPAAIWLVGGVVAMGCRPVAVVLSLLRIRRPAAVDGAIIGARNAGYHRRQLL